MCHKNISATFATLEADEYQTGLTAISACVDELDIFELDDVDLTFPVLDILDSLGGQGPRPRPGVRLGSGR